MLGHILHVIIHQWFHLKLRLQLCLYFFNNFIVKVYYKINEYSLIIYNGILHLHKQISLKNSFRSKEKYCIYLNFKCNL